MGFKRKENDLWPALPLNIWCSTNSWLPFPLRRVCQSLGQQAIVALVILLYQVSRCGCTPSPNATSSGDTERCLSDSKVSLCSLTQRYIEFHKCLPEFVSVVQWVTPSNLSAEAGPDKKLGQARSCQSPNEYQDLLRHGPWTTWIQSWKLQSSGWS